MDPSKKEIKALKIILLTIFTILFWELGATHLRIEYEHKINLPQSATNLEIRNPNWYIPRGINMGQHSTASFDLASNDLDLFLKQYEQIHLEKSEGTYLLYCVTNHIKKANIMVSVDKIDRLIYHVELNADYN